jgi:DNA-binding transcriptional LysR family regulator
VPKLLCLGNVARHVGLPLFERMHRSVVLTEGGRRYSM